MELIVFQSDYNTQGYIQVGWLLPASQNGKPLVSRCPDGKVMEAIYVLPYKLFIDSLLRRSSYGYSI